MVTITSNLQRSLERRSSWIIDFVVDYTNNISKYKHLAGNGYIKLPKKLNHPRKRLINTHNIGNKECFRWCLIRYLHPEDIIQQEL